MRYGQGDSAVEVLARECGRPLPDVAGVRPTQLFARNADVDRVNGQEMAVCASIIREEPLCALPACSYRATVGANWPPTRLQCAPMGC